MASTKVTRSISPATRSHDALSLVTPPYCPQWEMLLTWEALEMNFAVVVQGHRLPFGPCLPLNARERRRAPEGLRGAWGWGHAELLGGAYGRAWDSQMDAACQQTR